MSNSTLDILKSAILLEKKGFALYSQFAKSTSNLAMQAFFNHMASEETEHVRILEEQYHNLQKKGSFSGQTQSEHNATELEIEKIVTKIKTEINAASFEAAAISAAIALEQNAIRLYESRAKEATNAEEIKMYKWLSNWEVGHLNALQSIENTLKEEIWNDNQFWPM